MVRAVALSFAFSLASASASALSWPSLSAPPAATRDGVNDAAVVISIEKPFALPKIDGAASNAADWYLWLTSTRGIAPARARLLRDGGATREEILAAVDDGAAAVGKNGKLWIVFIGHGAPTLDGKDGVLLGADAQATERSLASRGVSRSELIARAAKANGDVVIVLDACFSGSTPDGRSPLVPGAQATIPVKLKRPPARVALFTSSERVAGPLTGVARPAFSYLMLGALRGWGDANGDAKLSANEVQRYVDDTLVATVRDRHQRASLSGAGDVVLATNAREKGPDVARIVVGEGMTTLPTTTATTTATTAATAATLVPSNPGKLRVGMRIAPATPVDERQMRGVADDVGVLVLGVEPDGPAARAGVRANDLVTSVDGRTLRRSQELIAVVEKGQPFTALIVRPNRDRAEVRITPEALKVDDAVLCGIQSDATACARRFDDLRGSDVDEALSAALRGCELAVARLCRDGERMSRQLGKGGTQLRFAERGCKNGDMPMCDLVAVTLFTGELGAPVDKKRALPMLQAGCDRGAATPCTVLGIAHFQGDAVPQNRELGVSLIKKACELNDGWSCGKLGDAYADLGHHAAAQQAYAKACAKGAAERCR